MKVYAYSCIDPRRPGRRMHTVKVKCVAAATPESALAQVRYTEPPDVLIVFRNSWEPGEVFSKFTQMWYPADVDAVRDQAVTGTRVAY